MFKKWYHVRFYTRLRVQRLCSCRQEAGQFQGIIKFEKGFGITALALYATLTIPLSGHQQNYLADLC